MADNPAAGGLPAKAAALLGLPENLKFFSPYPFAGMNQQDASTAIEDKEFVYLENFVKVGNGQMRTLWDVGAAIYTAPTGKTIVYYKFYSLASTQYCAIFLSDGSAIQLNMATSAQTTIGASGFYSASSGYLPYARQWGSTYLIISNRNTTNDYWAWDGTLLYTAGTAAPNGVNLFSVGFSYSSTPTVSAYGGLGSGMTFNVQVNDGAVSEVLITNPGSGYLPGDIVQLRFSGGGSDTTAILQAVLTAGGVAGVNISTPGSGYTSAPSVAFSGGGGTGAAGTATIATGVSSIAVTAGGTGYASPPSVAFSGGGGVGAAATAVVSGGVVTAINVTAAGTGYTSAPTVALSGGGGGSGATATATTSGVVSGVSITASGSGYTSAPTVAFSGGAGSGAAGVAALSPQGVQSVTVVNGGSGYGGQLNAPVPTLTFEGGGGSGATAVVTLNPSVVAGIVITNPGSGYQPATGGTVIIIAAGNNTSATAHFTTAGGAVNSIVLTNGGSGIQSPVTVTLSGPTYAGGVQATAEVRLAPQSIASVLVTNPGQFYTSAPAVIVSAGDNNAASATVQMMPFGVSGSAFETYLSRVWIVAPATAPYQTIPAATQWSFSAADSVSDFATSDGGGASSNTDAFLQTRYTGARQSSGYLYFFGDGSASVVTNVGTSGTPATTTYSYQNVDPQAGLSWRDCLQDYGRSLVVANELGIYGLYGGAMTKVSAKIDQLLSETPEGPAYYPQNGGVVPSSAVATIFNVKHYLGLMTLADPATGTPRNVMVAWNEKDWFIASQSVSFTFIAEQKAGSQYTAYGTDGNKIYPMFQTPSATLQKRMWTKAYGADSFFVQKQAVYLWLQAQDQSAGGAGVSGTVAMQVSTMASLLNGESPPLVSGTYTTALEQPAFAAPLAWPIWGTNLQGLAFTTISAQLTTTSPDFKLGNLTIGYLNVAAYSG